MNKQIYSIGKVAVFTDINIETIRYYERRKLVASPARSEGGNRLYTQAHIQQLKFIKRGRQLGFSLEDIRALLTLSSDSKEDCSSAKKIAEKHLTDIQQKIEDLNQLACVLNQLAADCDIKTGEQCPILASLNSG